MKNRFLRWLPWLSIAALLVLLLCHEWFGPDIWYHLYLGERILHTGNPQPSDNLILQQAGYVNLYWLFQLLVLGVFAAGGIYGVSALFIALWAVAAGFWLRTTGALKAGAWGPVVALAAGLLCQTRFEQRPEVLSYVFLAMQVWWLATWGENGLVKNSGTGVPPVFSKAHGRDAHATTGSCWEYARFALVQVLWTNVHGYFIFGPALVGLKMVCVAVGAGETKRLHVPLPRRPSSGPMVGTKCLRIPLREVGLLGLTVLASLASPFGVRGWAAVWEFGKVLRQMRFSIQELLPLSRVPVNVWSVDVFWVGWCALLAATVIFLFRAGRKELFAVALAAVGLYLSTVAFRNIPLLVFLGAPLVGVALRSRATENEVGLGRRTQPPARDLPKTSDDEPKNAGDSGLGMAASLTGRTAGCGDPALPSIIVALIAFALSFWVVSGGFYRSMGASYGFGIRESKAAYPVEFSDYLRANPFKGSIFDSPEDGGYLEFHFPDLRLYGDSRVIDVPQVRTYFGALHSPARFRELQSRERFDGALLSFTESREVIAALRRDPDWKLAYSDRYRAFFVNQK